MAEYINYRGKEVAIGTLDNLYYVSFQRYSAALSKGYLGQCRGSDSPANYIMPDTGSCFRFPFPDEDDLPFGQIKEPYNRGISIKIDSSITPTVNKFSLIKGTPFYEVDIIQQGLVHRQSDGKLCLALILREKGVGYFRIEDDAAIKQIIAEIIRNNISVAETTEQKNFLRIICARILKGYRLEESQKNNLKTNSEIDKKVQALGKGKLRPRW